MSCLSSSGQVEASFPPLWLLGHSLTQWDAAGACLPQWGLAAGADCSLPAESKPSTDHFGDPPCSYGAAKSSTLISGEAAGGAAGVGGVGPFGSSQFLNWLSRLIKPCSHSLAGCCSCS